MVIKNINFTDFALDPKLGLKDYSVIHHKNGIPLKFFLVDKDVTNQIKSGRTPSKFNEEYWNGDYNFLTMQDVDTSIFKVGETSEKITDVAIEEEKTLYQAPENALIVSNAMTVGLAFTTDKPIFINQNVFHINIDENKLNKVFAKWYFNLIFRPNFEKVFVSKYFSKDEYGRIKFPDIPLTKQNQIATKIDNIEKQIIKLASASKEPLEITNDVFSEYYKYDKKIWLNFGKGMTAGTQKSYVKDRKWYSLFQSDLINSNILRFSTRFHNPITQELTNILNKKPTKQIKDIISIEIKRGVQPKADENGDVYAIKTGQLKNGFIDLSEADKVNQIFFEKNLKAQVFTNDILIASTGKVSLGKVDLYEFEEDSIVDGHVSILRINSNEYNLWFLTYFLRSILGAFQIERDYTGTTNQIELYPDQIANFSIPDIPFKEQEKIVTNIKDELDKQKIIEVEISRKRQQIKELIEESIK